MSKFWNLETLVLAPEYSYLLPFSWRMLSRNLVFPMHFPICSYYILYYTIFIYYFGKGIRKMRACSTFMEKLIDRILRDVGGRVDVVGCRSVSEM